MFDSQRLLQIFKVCQINLNNAPCEYEQWLNSNRAIGNFPLDAYEFCLFHSNESGWKIENDFESWMNKYIDQRDIDNTSAETKFEKVRFVASSPSGEIKFHKNEFGKNLSFTLCDFEDFVGFNGKTFNKTLKFTSCKFKKSSFFRDLKLFGSAFWNDCDFFGPAYFNDVSFSPRNQSDWIGFNFSTFRAQANFPNLKFLGKGYDTNFQCVEFHDNVYFTNSTFESSVLYNGTLFKKRGDFRRVTFKGDVYYNSRPDKQKSVIFDHSDFSGTVFGPKAQFSNAHLGIADFSEIKVSSTLDFIDCRFKKVSFDKLEVWENSKLTFAGSLKNKVFEDMSSFQLIGNAIADNLENPRKLTPSRQIKLTPIRHFKLTP